MKKKTILLLISFFIISVSLFAHPPKNVKLEYNKETTILTITIEHGVNDIKDHFIDEITIEVNGEEVKDLTYEVQSSKEKHVVEIKLPEFKKGGELEVKAKCNKFGGKKEKLEM